MKLNRIKDWVRTRTKSYMDALSLFAERNGKEG